MVTPKSGFWVGSWKSGIETIICAVLAASIIQICRTPDEVPPPPDKTVLVEKPMIPMALNHAMIEPTPQKITIPEEMANNYLRSTLKPKSTGLIDNELKFLRALVRFREGACQFTTEQSVYDFPLYARVAYRLTIADNKVNAICIAGSLGRLPVHPFLMKYADLAFQNLWDALEREHKLLDQMFSIEMHEGSIVLVTKPKRL